MREPSGCCDDHTMGVPERAWATNASSRTGVTLLEVLVGMTILLMVVVPLSTLLARAGSTRTARDKLTATCILEQEAAVVRHLPSERSMVRKRILGGREWTIRCESSGGPLVKWKMSVEGNGRVLGTAGFMVHDAE